MIIYKNVKLRLLQICIFGIKFNIYVCDKNFEIIVIMIREIKNQEKRLGVYFLEDVIIVNYGLNNIRFWEDWWDRFFLIVLLKFIGKYLRSLLI